MQLVKYLIGRTPSNQPIWVGTRQENADFYGWSESFEPYIEGYFRDPNTGHVYLKDARLKRNHAQGARPFVISRAPSKSGFVATMNNQFRVSSNARLRDLAALAYGTKVDWHWMTTPSGERRSREEWLAIHEAFTQ